MLSHLVSLLAFITPALGYLIDPPTTAPDDTVQDCTNWAVATSSDTCESIADDNFLSLSDLYKYNPSLSASSCPLIVGDSYCVEENFGVPPPPPTSTSTTTTSNGISTPSPVQTGIASNCNKFYEVQLGDICDTIVAAYGISLSNFYAWNPAVGSSCTTLIPGDYVCVGVIGSTATTTTTTPTMTVSSGNGIATPTPIQTGMVSDCDKFYLVKTGDTCDTIAAAKGISVANFCAWNPAAGLNTCKTLQAQTYACVGVQSYTTNAYGLVVPQPAGASCGISAVSNGGTTLVSYSSGTPVASLSTTGYTNLYLDPDAFYNLKVGPETHKLSLTSSYVFYEAFCFQCALPSY